MKKRTRIIALGSVVATFMIGGMAVQVMGQSMAWMQILNNNHIIETQEAGGDSVAPGEVEIAFFGHAAFRITSPSGFQMMFDPWRNDPSGAWGLWFPGEFPKVNVDAVLSTHAHFDHDAVYRPQSPMVLDRMAGTYQFGDVKITGLADKHTCVAPGWYKWTNALADFGAEACPPNNPGHLDNVIFVVETGGMRIAVWGDNRDHPADHVWAGLNDLDVLILPVDSSQHILSYAQDDAIVDRLKPHVVIPEHYLTAGASITLTTLGTAEEWADTHEGAVKLDSAVLKLNPDEVRKLDRKVMYFGAEHLSE
jgi:L-ascorbate metabolism protein UlaG (beta-lactamase superfamily)